MITFNFAKLCVLIANRFTIIYSHGQTQKELVMKPAKHQRSKQRRQEIYVGRSTTLNNLFLCVHTLCMNYVTNTFLLVRTSVRSKQLLCFVQGQSQKSEQKHTTKNFDDFHHHSPLLTMQQWMIGL